MSGNWIKSMAIFNDVMNTHRHDFLNECYQSCEMLMNLTE
jgi:hypothetical protein